MNALAELQKRARATANSANRANQRGRSTADSHDSRDSQRAEVENDFAKSEVSALLAQLAEAVKPLRAHLLTLADAERIDSGHVHRLTDLDITACIGLDSRQLAEYLAMLTDTAKRHSGHVPAGDTAVMHCIGCGLVWVHPDVAVMLPVVGGWPRALGCPWCFVRKAGGYIPRPPPS